MATKTDQQEEASTLIEDLNVNQDDEVRGGIGVGELQETSISKMSTDSSNPIASAIGHGTHVAGTIAAGN